MSAAETQPDQHRWRLRKTLPERYGERCTVLARGRGPGPRNVLIQFTDGVRVVGARFCVERWRPEASNKG